MRKGISEYDNIQIGVFFCGYLSHLYVVHHASLIDQWFFFFYEAERPLQLYVYMDTHKQKRTTAGRPKIVAPRYGPHGGI